MNNLDEARIRFEVAEALELKCRAVRDSYKGKSKEYLAALEVQIAVSEEAMRLFWKWVEVSKKENEAFLGTN